MDDQKAVEKLSSIVHDVYVKHDISMGKSKDVHVPYEGLSEHWKEYDRVTVRAILNEGYIHKSTAVDYVDICSGCKGKKKYMGFGKDYTDNPYDCPICSGTGIVLREEK